ncbi:MAG: DUF481 domain-containing protein [Bacteroidales bacterium]
MSVSVRLSAILALSLISGVSFAAKIDTIYFQNGDRITGEVKSLQSNHLKLSTNDAGTVIIEWNKVDSVRILSTMRVVLRNGSILYGTLRTRGQVKGCFIWQTNGDPRQVRLDEIVEMSRLEDRILSRLTGSLSAGFSYTKASDIMQMNLDGSVTYTAAKNQIDLFYDGIYTLESEKRTQRQNGGISFRRVLPRRYFLVSALGAESSSEQQLDLRTSAGIGAGNSLIYSNITHLYLAAGILGNREWSGGEARFNLEGQITLNYTVYIYDSPEISLNIRGDLIPSINDPGRIRTKIDSNLRWEIFSDFFLKWTFFHTFDSRPFSETASKNDWAVSLLGLEYKL